MNDKTKTLGRQGEDAAAEFLRSSGLRILARNFRTRYGEIDIIAEEGDTLVFVEVKARTSDKFGRGGASVGAAKQKKIINTAALYLQQKNITDKSCRFDVLEIYPNPSGGFFAVPIKGAFEA